MKCYSNASIYTNANFTFSYVNDYLYYFLFFPFLELASIHRKKLIETKTHRGEYSLSVCNWEKKLQFEFALKWKIKWTWKKCFVLHTVIVSLLLNCSFLLFLFSFLLKQIHYIYYIAIALCKLFLFFTHYYILLYLNKLNYFKFSMHCNSSSCSYFFYVQLFIFLKI